MSTSNSNIGKETYLELISKDKSQVEKEQLEFQMQEAKHSVDVAVLETKKAIYKAKQELVGIKSANPYKIEDEIGKLSEIDSLEAGLKIAEKIQSIRFKTNA